MNPKDVARSYDSIAERWDSDGFPRENGIEQHKRAFAFSNRRGKALDIGCGASGRILDLLLEYGFEPEGLDLSERMIELARRRHPQVRFYHADICEWEFPARYDFISAWDSIWHIPLDEHERVLGKILSALSPGGVCIFTTGGVDAASEKRDAAMGVPMYHSAPGISRTLKFLFQSGCACRHLEYDQYPAPHVYIIAQKLTKTD
jgi:SAM-dependent methyltransferase